MICCGHLLRLVATDIENADRSAVRREAQRDGLANTAASAGHHGAFAIEAKIRRIAASTCQKKVPPASRK